MRGLSWLGVLLVGCAGPIPAEKYCSEVSRARCERAQRCGTLTRAIDCSTFSDDPNCLAVYQPAIAAGAIRYNAQEAGRCVAETRSAACDAPPYAVAISSCGRVIEGGGEGAPCGTCSQGFKCVGPGSACGVCKPIPQQEPIGKAGLGEACLPPEGSEGGCVGDLVCQAQQDPSFRCIARLPKGSFCGLAAWCEVGTYCRPEGGEVRCGDYGELGEPCDPFGSCKSQLRCVDGRCALKQQNGESCEAFTECASAWCRGGRCEVPGAEGEPCGNGCQDHLLCVDGICAPRKDPGAPCMDSTECAGVGRCVDGACHDLLIDCH